MKKNEQGSVHPLAAKVKDYAVAPIHRCLPPLIRLLEQRQLLAGACEDINGLELLEHYNKKILEILNIPT